MKGRLAKATHRAVVVNHVGEEIPVLVRKKYNGGHSWWVSIGDTAWRTTDGGMRSYSLSNSPTVLMLDSVSPL